MSELFKVVAVNPNDNCGAGGCLCYLSKHRDQQGPFTVWPAADLVDPMSPHAVQCAPCVAAAARAVSGEVLAGGNANDQLKAQGGDTRAATERKPNPGL